MFIVETSTKPRSPALDYECFFFFFYVITKPIATDYEGIQLFETSVMEYVIYCAVGFRGIVNRDSIGDDDDNNNYHYRKYNHKKCTRTFEKFEIDKNV